MVNKYMTHEFSARNNAEAKKNAITFSDVLGAVVFLLCVAPIVYAFAIL